MEIIKNFGIDPVLLVAQVVNFLVVLFLLRKFLYKPIFEMLKKRQDLIKEGIRKSEEANVRLAKALEEEKTILKDAQTHAKNTIEGAKKQMLEKSQEMQENAKKQAEKMLLAAREQITYEAKETERRLTANISDIAVKFLEKSLQGIFSESEQKEIFQKAIRKIKK